MRLILASASPRRADLLKAAGIPFDVLPAEVDETPRAGEDPRRYVTRLAHEKAAALSARAVARPVLAADTVVVARGEILGKPRDPADARRMLHLLSGAQHVVMTGVCLSVPGGLPHRDPSDVRLKADTTEEVRQRPGTTDGRTIHLDLDVTTVEFVRLSAAALDWYVRSGEPMDKAGGYAIQGLASRFVTRIEGSYSNVVGLPVSLVYGMCRRAGLLLS